MKIWFYLFFGCLSVLGANAFAQNISNEGTDFWTVFPTHDPSGAGNLATMNVNITSKNNSRVTVSCGSYTVTQNIPANTVVTFEVDRPQSYIDYSEGNSKLANRGIHIQVAPGMPKVVAYSHVFANARSAATLILPKESLGQKYYAMNYTQDQSGQNFVAIVAVEDDTDLILHKTDGTTQAINLPKAGYVYEYLSTSREDFTGTFIEVDPVKSPCKRFAAFSGSTSITIACSGSRDPLLQQLYSVNSWGKNYGIAPFKDRRYIFRVLAQEDNTRVRLDGNLISTLNKGQFYESPILSNGAIVSADKLISVAQYSLTQACSSLNGTMIQGDPEMVLLNPIEFNIKNITVFSSNRDKIIDKYVNVFIKTSKIATFRLNGASPSTTWIAMAADPTYSYTQIKVDDISLTLTADEGFNAIAYGFGQAESYAYSAGTNLYSTSTIALLNTISGLSSFSSACLGQSTIPKLTVPYPLNSITWDFNDGNPPVVESNLGNPVVGKDIAGNTTFTYAYSGTRTFNTLGAQFIKAIAVLSVNDMPCFDGSDLEFNFEIEVVPLGNTSFDVPEICAGTPIQFFDKSSIISGNSITAWKWDFDGILKTVQNPLHTFTKGKHTVKLSVANAAGCWSDVLTKTFTVIKDFPKLEFTALKPVCVKDSPIQFVASEKIGLTPAQTLTGFKGKGVASTGVFNPSVAGVGIHKITYVFSSLEGCTDSISQDIEVYATTVIDAPSTVYILAGGQRVIPASIKTPIATYNYKYKWTPSSGLSKDDVLSPIASPESDTRYTLTISIDGLCDVSQEVLVKVLNQVKPPNSFSPNGDGINDIWNIPSLDSYPDSETSIFNRSGQKVFFSKGYSNPFDGNYKNNPLPTGVYYYVIDPKNGRGKVTGPLTLIR